MRTFILALALAAVAAKTAAQPSDMRGMDGICAADSHIAEGNIGEDLTKRQSRFFCDIALFWKFKDDPDHVLIQFTDRRSHYGRTLGFGGLLNEDGMVVDHVYLETGQAITPDFGICRFFHKGKRMIAIWCGLKIDDEQGRRTAAVVDFKTR